jgi:hypothetical protein
LLEKRKLDTFDNTKMTRCIKQKDDILQKIQGKTSKMKLPLKSRSRKNL